MVETHIFGQFRKEERIEKLVLSEIYLLYFS